MLNIWLFLAFSLISPVLFECLGSAKPFLFNFSLSRDSEGGNRLPSFTETKIIKSHAGLIQLNGL